MTHDVARTTARAELLAETPGLNVKLSIVMPAYNEDRTIAHAVETVLRQSYPCPIELIVVDDGSANPVEAFLVDIRDPRLRVHRLPENRGKGAALRHGAELASGTHFVPFDADMEYDPADLGPMLTPVIDGRSHVVYGTRLFGVNTRYQSYIHGFSNRTLTLAANLMFDAYMSDLHTCLKLMPLDVFRSFPLRESGFGLDTEITAWLLRAGLRPFEVPVSYHSRSRESGKKINWRDGVVCLRVLGRVRRSTRLELSTHFIEPFHGRLAAVEPLADLAEVEPAAGESTDPLNKLAEEIAGREGAGPLREVDAGQSGLARLRRARRPASRDSDETQRVIAGRRSFSAKAS